MEIADNYPIFVHQ